MRQGSSGTTQKTGLRLVYLLGPALVFVLVNETVQGLLWTALQNGAAAVGGAAAQLSENAAAGGMTAGEWESGGVGLFGLVGIWRYLAAQPGNAAALFVLLGVLAGLLCVLRAVRQEIPFWEGRRTVSRESGDSRPAPPAWRIFSMRGRARAAFLTLFLFGTLSLAFALNVLFSLLGAGDAGAAQTAEAAVSAAEFGAVGAGLYRVQPLLGAAVYGLAAPLAEEAVFRGVLFNRLRTAAPLWAACLFSALFFGLYHGNPAQLCYGTAMGAVFAVGYAASGRFVFPFLLHAAANLLIFTASYTGVYARFVTPAWGALFAALTAMSAGTIWFLEKRNMR